MSHHEGLKMALSFVFLCACGIVVPWLYVWLGLMVLEHCSQRVFKAKSKATAGALDRMDWSLLTR